MGKIGKRLKAAQAAFEGKENSSPSRMLSRW
jgi:hypothetical protein